MTTLKDVAKRAHVSQMTVSRVLNHPETVSAELKSLVFQAMKELDYHPNAMAKALANKRTHVIKILILENITRAEPYYMRVLSGISKVCRQKQYFLQLLSSIEAHFDDCDGVIVMGAKENDLAKLAQITKPLVCFGENQQFDFVDTNNCKNLYQATKYAASCGYEQLYYIGLDLPERFAKQRQVGYERAITDLNKKHTSFLIAGDKEHDLDFFTQLKFPPNSAFICATDRIALDVITHLEQRGKKIPTDYGVIGHDGILLDSVSHPQLTTIAQKFEAMGTYLAEMLLAKIYTEPLLASKLFDAELIARKTTRPIK